MMHYRIPVYPVGCFSKVPQLSCIHPKRRGKALNPKVSKGVSVVKLKDWGLKWLKGFHLIAVCCWVGGYREELT